MKYTDVILGEVYRAYKKREDYYWLIKPISKGEKTLGIQEGALCIDKEEGNHFYKGSQLSSDMQEYELSLATKEERGQLYSHIGEEPSHKEIIYEIY